MNNTNYATCIYNPKYGTNLGTMTRTAELMGADRMITLHRTRCGTKNATDTANSWDHIGLDLNNMGELRKRYPHHTLVAVDINTGRDTNIYNFHHPARAVYIFGAEDKGLPNTILDQCDSVVTIPAARPWSMNVATSHAAVCALRGTQHPLF